MIDITAVHLVDGIQHQHIAELQWLNPTSGDTGRSPRSAMVDWLSQAGNRAVVRRGGQTVEVGVVKAQPPYVRTYADSFIDRRAE